MADLSKLKARRNPLGAPPPPGEASGNLAAPELAPSIMTSVANGSNGSRGAPETVGSSGAPADSPIAPLASAVAGTVADLPNERESPRQRVALKPTGKGRLYDARSARRTNRTVQFATRVSPEFDDRLRRVAKRDGLLLVEVMERALDAYEKAK